MEVADRQTLGYVYKELNFQMSGDVSDKSARSIGKFLGADLVIRSEGVHTQEPAHRFAGELCNPLGCLGVIKVM
jgi:hypothetical protein